MASRITLMREGGLSSEERRAELARASRDYLDGKIDQASFRKAEQKYKTDYSSAFYELSRFKPWINRQISRIFRS